MGQIPFSEYDIPIVVVACVIVGYIIKKSLDFIPNKYIPMILAVLGAVLGCVANKRIDLDYIVEGAFSGLSGTGLHQAFIKYIEKTAGEDQ